MKFTLFKKERVNCDKEIDLLRETLKFEHNKVRKALLHTKMDRDYWKAKYEGMEKQWIRSRKRATELRVEKLELEAKLSDTLALLDNKL